MPHNLFFVCFFSSHLRAISRIQIPLQKALAWLQELNLPCELFLFLLLLKVYRQLFYLFLQALLDPHHQYLDLRINLAQEQLCNPIPCCPASPLLILRTRLSFPPLRFHILYPQQPHHLKISHR